MEVIPLTLVISLLLSLTFIALFLREFTRPRRAGAEHESLLPLAPETASAGAAPAASAHACGRAPAPAPGPAREHVDGDACAEGRTGAPRCNSCRRREERAAARAEARAAASPAVVDSAPSAHAAE